MKLMIQLEIEFFPKQQSKSELIDAIKRKAELEDFEIYTPKGEINHE